MTNSLIFSPLIPVTTINKPGLISTHGYTSRKPNWISDTGSRCKNVSFESLKVKATGKAPTVKTNSIICYDCEGNGNKKCVQCLGTGVNSVDHFNGQFKAGGLCWLCRGKKEILCGECNGAGFLGGFMSTQDN